jgi:hypothetical protein
VRGDVRLIALEGINFIGHEKMKRDGEIEGRSQITAQSSPAGLTPSRCTVRTARSLRGRLTPQRVF